MEEEQIVVEEEQPEQVEEVEEVSPFSDETTDIIEEPKEVFDLTKYTMVAIESLGGMVIAWKYVLNEDAPKYIESFTDRSFRTR